jgi:hypothetical protein
MRAILTLGICVLLSAVGGCSLSRVKTVTHPSTINEFVKQYVAAINARDVAAYRSLASSSSLACITAESSDYYDRAFQVNLRHPISADYKFTAKEVGKDDKLGFEGYAVFPVRPTQQVQIDYTQGMENSGTLIFWLIHDNTGWSEVFPCATPATLQKFKADLPEIKASEEKTKALVAGLKEPLRGELIALLKQGKSSTAATRYAESTGQDHETGMRRDGVPARQRKASRIDWLCSAGRVARLLSARPRIPLLHPASEHRVVHVLPLRLLPPERTCYNCPVKNRAR